MIKANYLVKLGRLEPLKQLINEYRQLYPEWKPQTYTYTFKLLFINACMHGHEPIAQYLYNDLYKQLKETDKKEQKKTFIFCYEQSKKHNKSKKLENWLSNITSSV